MAKNRTILIVDDDDDDRALFFDAMREIDSSIKCLSANDGHDALKFLKNSDNSLPDYIFLDLNMPRLNGKQFLAEIKKLSHLSHIPVIIYSTTGRKEDIDETKRMGALQFITKPTLFNEIVDAIMAVLEPENRKNVSPAI
jgi:DNA-binding NtrC family response regulator